MQAASENRPLTIGSVLFPRMDQLDFTGPFEVFARMPDTSVRLVWKITAPVQDFAGLALTPQGSFEEAPQFYVLHIPGGPGQEALMDDDATLSFIRKQSAGAQFVFSVCTGALICGAAGLLWGRKATTHWAAFDLLPLFGATPVSARIVLDGKLMTTAGVTSGIDGALQLAALLRGDKIAQEIQLGMQYAPEPPFHSGMPDTAPREVFDALVVSYKELQSRRRRTAERIGARLTAAHGRC